MALQNLRSNTANKRPTASGMVDGQVAINTNATNPGLFFKDAGDGIRKVGPVFIGSSAPNSSPAAGGSTGHSIGEQWLDTSASRYVLKTWDGTAWRDDDSNYLQLTGGALSGALTIDNAANVAALDLKFDGDTDTGFYSPSANTLGVATGGIERLRFDSSGRVGIGTTSPNRVFEIQNASPIIRLTESAGTYSEISASTSILSFRADEGNGAANTRMDFRLNGSEKMRIDSSGNVGIGTSSPGFKLEVNSDTSDSVALFQSTDATARIILRDNGSTSGGYVGVATEDMFFHTNGTERMRIDSSGNARFTQSIRTTASNGSTIIGEFGRSSLFITGGSQDDLGIRATGNMRFAAGGNTERMRIDSSGRVGIGTTSPLTKLAVNCGTDNAAGEFVSTDARVNIGFADNSTTLYSGLSGVRIGADGNNFALYTANSERMRIDNTGRLLVGTTSAVDTSAEAIVHVVDTLGARLVLGRNDTSVADGNGLGGIRFAGNDTTSNTFTTLGEILCQADGTHAAGDNPTRLTFKTTPDGSSTVTERMRIDSSGRVGIGESDPDQMLHISEAASGTTMGVIIQNTATADDSDARLTFNTNSGGAEKTRAYIQATGNTSGVGNLIFATRKSGSTSESARIDSSGNFGVGLASLPATGFNRVIRVKSATGAAGIFAEAPDTSSWLGLYGGTSTSDSAALLYPNTGSFRIGSTSAVGTTSFSEKLRVDSSGRVGIGVASPGRILHVDSGSTSNSYARFTNNNSVSNGAEIGLFDSGAAGPALVLNNTMSDGVVVLNTNSLERMRIDSSGNVGIGTSSADSLVHLRAASGNAVIRLENSNTSVASAESLGSIEWESNDASTGGAGVAAKLNVVDDNGFGTAYGMTFSTGLVSGGSMTLSERMRIDSSGNVKIGTTAPPYTLTADELSLSVGDATTHAVLQLYSGSDKWGGIGFNDNSTDGSNAGFIGYYHPSNYMQFNTNNTERMRIDSAGLVKITGSNEQSMFQLSTGNTAGHTFAGMRGDNEAGIRIVGGGSFPGGGIELGGGLRNSEPGVIKFYAGTASSVNERMRLTLGSNPALCIGKTSGFNANIAGTTIGASGGPRGFIETTRDGGTVLTVARLTSDGKIVSIRQGTSEEGTITVSGSTVSYNGGHLARWSQLAGGAERTEILRGSVLSNLDEMCEWGEEDNEQLNRMKVSDVEGDVNVSGVFQAWDDDDDTYDNDFYCAMTGDFVIRIAQGTTVSRGDLLMSAGDGTAKPQDDDIVRSKTIAKVTSTTVSTTYSDGSYCVPCVLMAC